MPKVVYTGFAIVFAALSLICTVNWILMPETLTAESAALCFLISNYWQNKATESQ